MQQLIVVAAWKIRAPDGACEQHVADDREARGAIEEHDMPWGVTGAVLHFELDLADGDDVAIVQPARRDETFAVTKAVVAGVLRDQVDPELVAFMRAFDRQMAAARELGRRRGMIDMGMGQQDLLEGQAFFLDHGQHFVEIPAGIDDGGAARPLAPDDGAVLLERGDGNDGDLHGLRMITSRHAR
jgi:hypothetical protein